MRSFHDRVKSLQRAHKNAQNIEFKNLWFDMLVRLLEDERPDVISQGNNTIH